MSFRLQCWLSYSFCFTALEYHYQRWCLLLIRDTMQKCFVCRKGVEGDDLIKSSGYYVCSGCYHNPVDNVCSGGCGKKYQIPFKFKCYECFNLAKDLDSDPDTWYILSMKITKQCAKQLIGKHQGCGGEVYYFSARNFGFRKCFKCNADGMRGTTSPSLEQK